jgi:hypothetical protein
VGRGGGLRRCGPPPARHHVRAPEDTRQVRLRPRRLVGREPGARRVGGSQAAGARERWKVLPPALPAGDVGAARRAHVAGGRGGLGRLRRSAGGGGVGAGGETTHVFVPLGFEARTGAFGPRTRTFLREVAEVAEVASSSDLYHWCAMVGGEHWEQRSGVKLAHGEASLVLVASARANAEGVTGREASPEWSPTDC